jgi:D-beta-D-heptose 7-phosphate kinase/D-beta-D-heptose 1-phosphate adenosyltransferase
MNIWTNGCFDIIHAGHIELFKYAKSLGNHLYVGIDSDDRIKLNKGKTRPINNVQCRQTVLESIKYIDKVFIFDSDKVLESTIQKLSIDTMVVGDDYINKKVIGAEYVNKIIFFPRTINISTSKIMDSMVKLYDKK